MKVLVSGVKGAFGSELVKHIEGCDTISLRYGGLSEEQKKQLSGCNTFIHCGALLKGSFNDLYKSNFLLTKDILDYLSEHNPSCHVIYFSSMSLLRKKKDVHYNDYLNPKEMSDYALSKYLTEVLCSRYRIPITILRFSTLFYENPTRDGLSKMVYDATKDKRITLYNKGVAKRNFMPLEIAIQYVLKIAKQDKFLDRTYNIVSGKETSFKEVAKFLGKRIGNLGVNNVDIVALDRVPSDFSTEDIRLLGEIKFNLWDIIGEYINEVTFLR